MTAPRLTERELASRLTQLAAPRTPDYLDDVLAVTARTRRRPAWMFPGRWLPMTLTTVRPLPLAVRWRPLVLLALLVLALVATLALLAGSPRRLPAPFGLAENGLIAYDDGGDIHLVDPATSGVRTLVGGPESDRLPSFAPLGDRLVFLRAAERPRTWLLMGMRLDDPRPRVLGGPYTSIDDLEWTPDGSAVVLVANGRLVVVATDGSGADELDLRLRVVEIAMRPPDGRQLLVRAVDGSFAPGWFILELATGQATRLPIRSQALVPADQDLTNPDWAPDGRRFASNAVVRGRTGEPVTRIVVTELDSAGALVAHERLEFEPANLWEGWPIWSPDGERLALNVLRPGDRGTLVAVGASDGSGELTILDATMTITPQAQEHRWSPDGTAVIARHWEEDRAWLLPADGSPSRQVPWWASSLDAPSWQRSGD